VDVRDPHSRSVYEPTGVEGPRIVAVCADLSDADLIAASLQHLNKGSLLAYRRQSELRRNPPLGAVSLFALFDRQWLEPTSETLHWLGRYWPRTSVAVIGSSGAGGQELEARMGGAIYFACPGYDGQWRSLVQLAAELAGRTDSSAA